MMLTKYRESQSLSLEERKIRGGGEEGWPMRGFELIIWFEG